MTKQITIEKYDNGFTITVQMDTAPRTQRMVAKNDNEVRDVLGNIARTFSSQPTTEGPKNASHV